MTRLSLGSSYNGSAVLPPSACAGLSRTLDSEKDGSQASYSWIPGLIPPRVLQGYSDTLEEHKAVVFVMGAVVAA